MRRPVQTVVIRRDRETGRPVLFFFNQSARGYWLEWEWSAPRFSGRIGARQDALYNRHGKEFLDRRIARCNRLIARFLQGGANV